MKYIKYLHLVNFQSHSNSVIELHPGLNIFVGESDQGKTAIIRALRWLFYNEPRGTGFIRVGETRCEVTAILSDETKVTRLRDEGKRQNRYIITYPDKGELVLEKFKNEVPLEVQQELGVYPLWIDTDQKLELNIARQLDSPFLISESAANRAKIIGRIANLHIIDAAQRELLRDIRSHSRQKADLEVEIERLEEEKKDYEDLPSKEKQLKQIKSYLDNLQKLKSKAVQLEEIEQLKIKLKEDMAKSENQLLKLQNIEKTIQVYYDFVNKANYYTDLYKLNNSLQDVSNELDKHNHNLVKLARLEDAATLYGKLIDLIKVNKELIEIKKNLQENELRLQYIDDYLQVTENLSQGDHIISRLYELRQEGFKLQQIRRMSRQLNKDIDVKQAELFKIKGKLQILQNVDKAENLLAHQFNNLDHLSKITELNLQKRLLETKVQEKANEINQLDISYKKMQEEYINTLSEAGTCPTCGSKITPVVIEDIIDKNAI